MKKEKDEDLDKLFKKGLEDPVNEPAYRGVDWDAMEQMLDKGKKRPAIVFWLPVIGSAAALILIFLGYLLLKPQVVKPGKQDQMAVTHRSKPTPNAHHNIDDLKKDNTGISGEPGRKVADSTKQQMRATAEYAGTHARKEQGQKSKSFFTLSSGKGRRDSAGDGLGHALKGAGSLAVNKTAVSALPANAGSLPVIANNGIPDKKELSADDHKKGPGDVDSTVKVIASSQAKQKDTLAANVLAAKPAIVPKLKPVNKQKLGNRPQFAVSVLASSDLNGVNSSFQQSKIGGNFGALFSVTFAKKWTITTGATYDIKPYMTGFDNYHTAYEFKTNPSSVDANCRMLDIPININYQVYSHQANRITLGTGLSSYFMLREDYKFNYADPYTTSGPTNYTVINKNRNILSVLNIDATYTHQINSKVGITVQPYFKIPLSDVGVSQVRLQSSGVALGFSWNINTSPKPK
jgi:hypothetical protein